MDRSLGNQLIFLISQPRAGSTMLQRILGSHPEIHTLSEPWLMLPPFYALRQKGYEAEFDADVALTGVRSFLGTLPQGEDAYFEGVRRMYTHLYDQALLTSNKRYFLDKTPRYYYIVPQLYRTFPEAHYIILLRNPMAVICSVLKTWVRRDWLKLCELKHDLTIAPHFILESIEQLGTKALVVHYEHIVMNPNIEIEKICKWVGVDFRTGIINYGHNNALEWSLGDQNETYRNERPILNHLDKWKESLNNPQVWRLANDYFNSLGKKTLTKMGYSSERIGQTLEKHRPCFHRRLLTVSLSRLIGESAKKQKRWLIAALRFLNLLQRCNMTIR